MGKNQLIPLTRPTLPKIESLTDKIAEILKSGMITDSKYVRLFEEECAKYLGVKYAVAVSCGTDALMMVLKCLDIKGEVILPSFTYSSGGHALLLSRIKPVFVDIEEETFNLDPKKIEAKITGNTAAIMPTHVFGNPCDIDRIEAIGRKNNLKIIYDGAHAFGSLYKNKSVAKFGDATIYSFTPTKVLTSGEGGLVVTDDRELDRKLRLAKLNGDSFNRDEEFLGFTARMSELQAILGLESLKLLDKSLQKRFKIIDYFKKVINSLDGISYQKIAPSSKSVYKDFAIIIDDKKTGFTRNELLAEFKKNNIQSKVYFDPPLHKKNVYAAYKSLILPNTDYVSSHILSLPLYSHMPLSEVKRVIKVIVRLFNKNKKI
ncbi:DegT/DnrJ/EryC1/StrS family aminotransferase [Candidatus Peregrinibacteria bacterium]|nr:DegT/DnrJ/EryC1/StrS family aminotransferase [Candidatus Peregrinibacteria bacterium]